MTTDYSYSMYGPWPSNCGPDMTKKPNKPTAQDWLGLTLALSGFIGGITLVYFYFDPVVGMSLGCLLSVGAGCALLPDTPKRTSK